MCLCGNEKVTVQDDNGKVLETTLKDLYEWQCDLPKPYIKEIS